MSAAPCLLLAALLLPVALLVSLLHRKLRPHALELLAPAPLGGLVAALAAADAEGLVLDATGLRLGLALGGAGALLMGAAALLWSAAGLYAAAYLRDGRHAARFAACWLLTLTGSLGCFMASDLLSFYLSFALVSIPAYGLIIHDGTPAAWRAGGITLSMKIGGEVALLLAFGLMAHAVPGQSLAIADAVAALPGSAHRGLAMGLLLAGFGLKAGLVPLHVWLPLAHPAAPMPASAVLSGAIIKAGIVGLIRFLPYGDAMPGWGSVMAAIGFATAFWGVLVGITQANPKTVLAYSSISQMGVAAAALGMGFAASDTATGWAAAFYAVHHVLAKGALFLCVGVAQQGAARLPLVLLPAVVLALGFGGLPPTGGYLAKLAVKDQLGYGLVGTLSTLSAIGSTVLMLHFVRRMLATAKPGGQGAGAGAGAGPALMLPWLALACLAIAVPWIVLLAGEAAAPQAVLRAALAPASLWAASWPVGIGAVLALAIARLGERMPAIPGGDLVVLYERAAGYAGGLSGPIERAERALRYWPAAS
ncbi:MAG: hypothetical protein IT556_07600, partial [Acetobacteraceae bacterium]|nr:hypothetical protein [Acetobacteraceae bacterium]